MINFWKHQIGCAEDFWLCKYIKHRFDEFPDVVISSVLGPVDRIVVKPEEFWIHYVGENTFDRYQQYADLNTSSCKLMLDFWPEPRDRHQGR